MVVKEVEHYQVIIDSSKEQLEAVGISCNINGLTGTVKGDFEDGYLLVEVTYDTYGIESTYNFDIPQQWLKVKQL